MGTIEKEVIETIGDEPKEIMDERQKLDCIFDDEPLGFEKDLILKPKRSRLKILWRKLIWEMDQ